MEENELTLKIFDIVGGALCISSEDGDKIYQRIIEIMKGNKKIFLSFEGVEDLTSAFLNAAVGPLYNGDFAESELSLRIHPIDASSDDLHLLKRVVDRAKEFYKDPERLKAAERVALGYDDAQ